MANRLHRVFVELTERRTGHVWVWADENAEPPDIGEAALNMARDLSAVSLEHEDDEDWSIEAVIGGDDLPAVRPANDEPLIDLDGADVEWEAILSPPDESGFAPGERITEAGQGLLFPGADPRAAR